VATSATAGCRLQTGRKDCRSHLSVVEQVLRVWATLFRASWGFSARRFFLAPPSRPVLKRSLRSQHALAIPMSS